MRFVDTNIFLRYLTRDDPVKAEACKELLKRIDRGEEDAFTIEAAIVEVMFVLLSPRNYNMAREEVASRVTALLSIRNLEIAARAELLRACDLFARYPRLDLADALAVAYMERASVSEVVSYDRDFDMIPGIVRIEP
jgi:predicted nucleic acid-binding protein